MKRFLRWSAPALLLITAGLLAIVLFSETGLKWAFGLVQSQAPGALTADSLQGRLVGPVDISGLHYRDDGVDLRIGRLSLRWQPGRLFSGRVLVSELSLTDVDLRTLPSDEKPDTPAAPEALGEFAFELPLPIQIERFTLRDATWHPPAGEPVEVHEFRFSAMARESWITVTGLHLDTPLLTLDAEGLIPLASDGTLRLDLRFRSDLNQQTWTGLTTLRGSADDIDVNLSLDTPISVLGEGRIQAFADPLHWNFAAGTTESFTLDTFVPDSRATAINAVEIEARGLGLDISGSGHLALSDEDFGAWGVDLEGQWDGQQWRVDDFLLAALETETRITGQAWQVNDNGFQVDLLWEHLAWPLTGDARIGSPRGAATLTGTPDAYAIRLDGRVDAPELPEMTLALEGQGDRESLLVDALNLEWLNGHWHAAGQAAWSPRPAWDFTISARDIEPALLHPEAEGRLDAHARVSGHVDDTLMLDLDIMGIDGTLREHPFDSRARLSIHDDIIEITNLQLQSGAIELYGSAYIADTWDIDWRIDAGDLAVIDPAFTGGFESAGTVAGPSDALHARFGLQSSGLAWQAHGLDALALDADIELDPDGAWRVTTRADGVRTAGQEIGQVRIDSAGTMQDHTIDLGVEHDSHRFEQQLAGTLADGQWDGVLRGGKLEQVQIGLWTQDTTPLQLSATRQTLGDYCWTQQASAVCLAGSREGDEVHGELGLMDFNLDRFEPFLPDERMTLDGAIRGEAEFAWLDGRPGPLLVDIRGGSGSFGFMLPQQEGLHEMTFEGVSLKARADEEAGLQAAFLMTLNEREHLDGSLRMPQWHLQQPAPGPDHEIDARLGLELHDLSLLVLLVPELQAGPGSLSGTLDITGTYAAPRIDGSTRAGFDHLELARLGVRVDDVTLNADIRGNEWELEGSSRMDQGILDITGNGIIHDAGDWRGELALTGDNLQALNQPRLNIIVSPAITLDATPEELVFGGSLTIPRARIEAVAPESALQVSGDVVIVGDDQPETDPGSFRTHGRIEIILGDRVLITGMGFDGRLAGRLTVIVERDGGLNGQGEIQVVNGRYRAYGQDLRISQGRVLYAGGRLDNPAIDIVASRMRGDIEVGVRITGTAEQPQVSLFSNPAMDDGDILSYLVLGRPMDQATEQGDGQLLHQAATSVALLGGEALAERIADRFSLDEVTIESGEEVTDTALILGRAISDRIYIRYIQGLVENTNAFQIRYKISDKWTLETESGTRSGAGADILYSLER